MHKLKLAFFLPVLFCGVGGLLWYWELHTTLVIPRSLDIPSDLIGWGLEFPMYIVAALILAPFRDRLPIPLPQLTVLPLVAAFWYLIGKWLDRRREANDLSRPGRFLSSPGFQALILAFGVLALCFSFEYQSDIYYVVQSIQIALMQTWAFFLIGIPAVGILRHFLDKRRKKEISLSTPSAPTRISNFRLLEMIVGVFAILVLLRLPPGPLLPPEGFRRAVLQVLGR